MNIYQGQLTIDRTEGDEWGKLVVDDAIRTKCFELLGLDMLGFSIPDYEAHMSAFDEKETRQLPNDFWFEGRWCEFKPTHLRVVNPEGWDEVNACVILCVECKPIERLRKALGFPAKMYGDHEFHVTIGISENKIDGCIENIIRLFNEYLKDDYDKILEVELQQAEGDEYGH